MSEKSSIELKVGTFIFLSLIVFVAFVLLIGDFKEWTNRYNVKVVFGFVDGVKVGSPVRFAGLDVGEVKNVDIINPSSSDEVSRVQVIVRLKGHVRIPKDSLVLVNTLGLLGEKYIEIMPGKNYASFLKSEDTIVGKDPIPMHSIMRSSYDTLQDVKEIISGIRHGEGTIGKLIYDETVYTNIEAFTADIRKYP
ncbi:MAG: MlaD family protein [Candidatus Omnitrophica bacterium]|nr:MlaD family protein [Candidatus Omnitrophota bacterium]